MSHTKLSLKRETIRVLNPETLRPVIGGNSNAQAALSSWLPPCDPTSALKSYAESVFGSGIGGAVGSGVTSAIATSEASTNSILISMGASGLVSEAGSGILSGLITWVVS